MDKDTISKLLDYMCKNMDKDKTGLYPEDQIQALNDYFHSLKDVTLYHASPYDNISELKPEQGGKSGTLPDVYASVCKDFVPVFLVHNSSDKSCINTSLGTMDYSFANPSRIKEDNQNKSGFIYELDADHREFKINPNSKFGLFEATCPHAVKTKSKEKCENPIAAMRGKWNFYQPDLVSYYAYNTCIGDYLAGAVSKKELEQFYTKEVAVPEHSVSADAILNAPDLDKSRGGCFSEQLKRDIVTQKDRVLKEIRLENIHNSLKNKTKDAAIPTADNPLPELSEEIKTTYATQGRSNAFTPNNNTTLRPKKQQKIND